MPIIAVCGPDGAGKTTYIQEFLKPDRVFHAIPVTSKLPKVDAKWYRYVHELLMGAEKIVRFWYLRYKHDRIGRELWVLDRCFLDAEVYGSLWSRKTKSRGPLIISLLVNTFAYEPDVVWLFYVDPKRARPKRSYTKKDLSRLNALFIRSLVANRYERTPSKLYDFGRIIIWKRSTELRSMTLRGKLQFYLEPFGRRKHAERV